MHERLFTSEPVFDESTLARHAGVAINLNVTQFELIELVSFHQYSQSRSGRLQTAIKSGAHCVADVFQ